GGGLAGRGEILAGLERGTPEASGPRGRRGQDLVEERHLVQGAVDAALGRPAAVGPGRSGRAALRHLVLRGALGLEPWRPAPAVGQVLHARERLPAEIDEGEPLAKLGQDSERGGPARIAAAGE